jgi:hypothetical protein
MATGRWTCPVAALCFALFAELLLCGVFNYSVARSIIQSSFAAQKNLTVYGVLREMAVFIINFLCLLNANENILS